MKITQDKFWNLPEVKAAQDAQKQNQWGSKPHYEAFIKLQYLLMTEAGMTIEEANDYLGEY